MPQNEQLAIKTITSHYAVMNNMRVTSYVPGAKVLSEKNLKNTLRDHVTYPIGLIHEINAYGHNFIAAMRGYDARIQYNWDGYSDDDKKELIRMVNEESASQLGHGLKSVPIVFDDLVTESEEPGMERLGQMDYGDDGMPALLRLSNKLLDRSAAEAAGVALHEQAHGLISQYAEQTTDVTQGRSGVLWSRYGDHQKIYMNPEEALVRAFEVNMVETFAPGSHNAKNIRHATLDAPGYDRMAASKQYFDFVKG